MKLLFVPFGSSTDVCTLSLDTGTCDNNITRWFYNKDSKQCEQFLYSGCSGNRNNFEKLSQCLSSCGKINSCSLGPSLYNIILQCHVQLG